jgi:hypothetical protein
MDGLDLPSWQFIDEACHLCHWWQDHSENRITAMTELITTAIVLVALVAAVVALVRFARHDSFAGPGTGAVPHDELGPFTFSRRPA